MPMETKKIFTNRTFCLILLVLVLFHTAWYAKEQYDINGQTTYQEQKQIQKTLIKKYANTPPKKIYKELNRQMEQIDILEQIAAYEELPEDSMDRSAQREYMEEFETIYANAMALYQKYPEKYTQAHCAAQKQVRYELCERYQHLAEYQDHLKQIQKNAKLMEDFRLFQDSSANADPNIQKTATDYARLFGQKLELGNDNFLVRLYQCDTFRYVLLFFSVLLTGQMLSERKKGLWLVVYAAPAGRGKLAFRRIGVLAATVLGFELLLFGGMTLVSAYFYGWETNWSRMVQSIPEFGQCTVPMTAGQFLLFYLLMTFLSVLFQSILVWVFFTAFDYPMLALFCLGILYLIGYFLSTGLLPQSPAAILKYFNLYGILNLSSWLMDYRNFTIGSVAINRIPLLIGTLCAGIILLTALGIWIQQKKRPVHPMSRVLQRMEQAKDFLRGITEQFHIFGMELYKLLFLEKGAVILLVALAWCWSSISSVTVYQSPEEAFCTRFYEAYSGKPDSKMEEALKHEEKRAKKAVESYQKAQKQYANQPQKLERAEKKFAAAQGLIIGSKKIRAQLDELKDAQKHLKKELWLIDPRGYKQLIGESSVERQTKNGLLTLAVIIFLCAPLFSMEQRRGTRNVLCAAPAGRRRLIFKKAGAVALLAGVVTSMVYGLDAYALYRMIPFGDFQAPLWSLSFMQDNVMQGSIGEYLLLLMIFRICGTVCVGFLTGAFSVFLPAEGVLILGAVLLIPSILDVLKINIPKIFSLAYLQAVGSWQNGASLQLLGFYLFELLILACTALLSMRLYWCRGSADIFKNTCISKKEISKKTR